MKSIEEREALIKAKLHERVQSPGMFYDPERADRRVAMWGRRLVSLLVAILFFGFAFYGGLIQTVHGSFTQKFFYSRLFFAGLSAHILFRTLLLFTHANYAAYRSIATEIVDFFRIPSIKVGLRFVVWDVLVGYLVLLTPVTGLFQFVNSIHGRRAIQIEGPIVSVDSEPTKMTFYTRTGQYHWDYRVIQVLNNLDQKTYAIDLPEDYFESLKISKGQQWQDEIFYGSLGVFYRERSRKF